MNVLKIIQAHIQSIMFNKKVLQVISRASKIILPLKWHHHKQNQIWNSMLIKMWVFGVFRITQIYMI
jgi:exonuclease I